MIDGEELSSLIHDFEWDVISVEDADEASFGGDDAGCEGCIGRSFDVQNGETVDVRFEPELTGLERDVAWMRLGEGWRREEEEEGEEKSEFGKHDHFVGICRVRREAGQDEHGVFIGKPETI